MTPINLDSAYASRPMETDTPQWTTPALSGYQTPSTSASASTLAPSSMTERAGTSEQIPELPRKDRRASSSPKERHRSRTRRETAHDDDPVHTQFIPSSHRHAGHVTRRTALSRLTRRCELDSRFMKHELFGYKSKIWGSCFFFYSLNFTILQINTL